MALKANWKAIFPKNRALVAESTADQMIRKIWVWKSENTPFWCRKWAENPLFCEGFTRKMCVAL